MNPQEDMHSIQRTARIAGFLYLLLLPLGVFGILYVPSTLIDPGDVAATSKNILANAMLFRLSIISALVIPIVNIFVVLFLYQILKPVNQKIAMLMVLFLLIAVPIAFVNELTHFAVLLLLGGAQSQTGFTVDQVQALVSLFLGLHEHGIYTAQIFWGLWLLPMGYLVARSRFLPRVIGILLIVACFGYLIDSLLFFLYPDIDFELSSFTFIGEPILGLWLLIKGVDVERWEARATESAEMGPVLGVRDRTIADPR